jgi:excinuclease ABC subunit B
VYKTIEEILSSTAVADSSSAPEVSEDAFRSLGAAEREDFLETLKAQMRIAAEQLEFERAAELRDEIERLVGTRNLKTSKNRTYRYSRRKK